MKQTILLLLCSINAAFVLSFAPKKTMKTSFTTRLAAFETQKLKDNYDYLAPDTSEIRLLPSFDRGGLCHCTLSPGRISSPVKHKSVKEIWYFLYGEGKVARQRDNGEWEVCDVEPGLCLSIPENTPFQFRNTHDNNPLNFLISTMPKWPGDDEAIAVEGFWETKPTS